MAEIVMSSEHKAQLGRLQHVGEYLTAERVRLEAELAHVVRQTQQVSAEITAILQRVYGIDTQRVRCMVDAEHGVILTGDESPAEPESAPTPAE